MATPKTPSLSVSSLAFENMAKWCPFLLNPCGNVKLFPSGRLRLPLTLGNSPLCSAKTQPGSNTIPPLAADQRKTEPPAFESAPFRGQRDSPLLPSIPNGGVD